MVFKEMLELSGLILGTLGGGAAIIFGFSNWLGKVWASRLMEKEKAEHAQELEFLRSRLIQNNESYKIKLKKSEFIFQKEYEAASEFVALKRRFLPTYKHPDMDWGEACDEIAHDFHEIELLLGAYLSKHGAVLSPEVKNKIGLSIGIVGENKFQITGQDVPCSASKAADCLYSKFDDIEESLLSKIHSQSIN